MKVWYDACTGKHVRYAIANAKCLRHRKHQVILTTRKHPDTIPMADYLGEEFIVAGSYNPKSLLTRLKEGIERQLFFSKLFEKDAPDAAVSHGSVDQCRVAFGLGKPIIVTVDTPYAEAVHKLTLPLADYIVASKAIPERFLEKFSVDARIVGFDGVDEVAWIKDFQRTAEYDFGKPLIVLRPMEEKAVYTKETTDMLVLAKKLTRLGKVVFLSRYNRKPMQNLVVPKGFVDSASLVRQADLFVGVGGTITREAALQGTPAIIIDTYPHQYVNDFLIEKGFPIFKAEYSNTLKHAEMLLGKRKNVKQLLEKLENPVDTITRILDRKDL